MCSERCVTCVPERAQPLRESQKIVKTAGVHLGGHLANVAPEQFEVHTPQILAIIIVFTQSLLWRLPPTKPLESVNAADQMACARQSILHLHLHIWVCGFES